jgi:hypothetical protein
MKISVANVKITLEAPQKIIKITADLPCDPAAPILGTYLDKSVSVH